MKKLLVSIIGLFFSIVLLQAQNNDTIYFIKANTIVHQQSIRTADVDSVIFYKPAIAPAANFTDARDGNVYQVVQIGNQVWMAENLRYLPSVDDEATASNFVSTYHVYDYNGTSVASAKQNPNYAKYGVLYNWKAAMDGENASETIPSGVKGVCPVGWHLPSNAEWTKMETYLIANHYSYDGSSLSNKIAKSLAASTDWTTSTVHGTPGSTDNSDKINLSGFTALPGGAHYSSTFENIGKEASWWTTSHGDETYLIYKAIKHNEVSLNTSDASAFCSFSVRCVRD